MIETSSFSNTELICVQHHKQIKWLCLNPHCNQPFCQDCLSIHSLSHQKLGNKPLFKEINDLRKQTQQLVQNYAKQSDENTTQMDLNKFYQIQNKTNDWFTQLSAHILEIKAKCLKMVENHFSQHQQWLKQTLINQKQKLSQQLKMPASSEHKSKKKQFANKFEKVNSVPIGEFIQLYPAIKGKLLEVFNLEGAIIFEIQSSKKFISNRLADIQKHNQSCLVQFSTKLQIALGYLQNKSQGQLSDRTKNSKSCLKRDTKLQQNAKLVKWAWPVKQPVIKQQASQKDNHNKGYEKTEVLKPIHLGNEHNQQSNRNVSPNVQNTKKFFYNHRAGDQPQQYHINFQKSFHKGNSQPGYAYQQNKQTVFFKKSNDTSNMNFTYPVSSYK